MGKIIPVNPYNNNQIELIKDFEKEYKLDSTISSSIIEVSSSKSEKDYQISKRKTNTIEDYYVLEEEGKIKGLCHLYGEKDRKTCRITYPTLAGKSKTKQALLKTTIYAIEKLGMMEVLIDVDKDDKDMFSHLPTDYYLKEVDKTEKSIFMDFGNGLPQVPDMTVMYANQGILIIWHNTKKYYIKTM